MHFDSCLMLIYAGNCIWKKRQWQAAKNYIENEYTYVYAGLSWATYQAALQSTRAGAGLGGEFWKRKKRK